MRTRTTITGLVTALCLLTGCGLPGLGRGPADGWIREEDGHLVLERPAGWEPTDVGGQFRKGWTGDGMELRVAGEFSEDIGSQGVLSRIDLQQYTSVEGYSPEHTQDLEVEGAYDAKLRYYAYEVDGKRHEGAWIVAAQWPYPSTGLISIKGEDLDEDVVRHVANTLRFKEYH